MDKIAQTISELDIIIKGLSEIHEDSSVPRNVRIQIYSIVARLREEIETPIKLNRALNELDDIASDCNLQSYTRTQVWNVMSLLEKSML